MFESGPALWFIAVAIGPLLLAAAIAYGFMRRKQRTAAEKAATEAGTRDVYRREDSAPGP